MRIHIDYKVPGGKLLRIDAEVDNDIIKSVKLTGDFFIYPEKGVVLLERALQGKRISDIEETFYKVLKKNKLRVIGFDGSDLFEAFSRL